MNSEKVRIQIASLAILVGLLALWWILSLKYPPYILPSPLVVCRRGLEFIQSGEFLRHFTATATESLGGFFLGSLLALPLGYGMAKIPWLEKAISPYISASQAIPIVALAPLLIIWFGFGLTAKILVAALVAFFPVLTNLVIGLHRCEARSYELMAVLGATRWQVLTKLEIPSALPVIFAGFRVGLALSVIGAVVGEFASSNQGLGYMVNLAAGMMDTPLMFVALLSLAALGITFHLVLLSCEKFLLPWTRTRKEPVIFKNRNFGGEI